jgi:hypothetical protein
MYLKAKGFAVDYDRVDMNKERDNNTFVHKNNKNTFKII